MRETSLHYILVEWLHTASDEPVHLSWEPHPPQAEIEADPEFRHHEMTAQEFEAIWSQARQSDLQATMR